MTDPNMQFQAGDPLTVLYQGLYDGFPGHFVQLRADPKWADVKEVTGAVRAYPVLWLRHRPAISA